MLIRFALFLILAIFVARAFWRLVDGIVEGARGPASPTEGVSMVRDPVCGTFVVPGRAVALVEGAKTICFCSEACRDQYRRSAPRRVASS